MEGHMKHSRHGHTTGPRGQTTRSPTYNCWRAMIDRCYCPTSTAYPHYGAKGVTVCDDWREFGAFLAAMGERPSLGHSVDRIDNSKGYEPGNCRWATRGEQNLNRGNTRILTVRGETLPLVQWAERAGLKPKIIHNRIARGWAVERAVAA